jgi:serine acetyltransferase
MQDNFGRKKRHPHIGGNVDLVLNAILLGTIINIQATP